MSPMDNKNVQNQINEINSKLDLLIENSQKQSQKREEAEDLISDLSIIGKDFYDFSVKKLGDEKVELNDEVFTKIVLKFLRDINIFYEMLNSLENVFDLVKDLEPIANQIGKDFITKFAELEQKGYLKFISELGVLSDSIIKNFNPNIISVLSSKMQDISSISKNIIESSIIEDTSNFLEIYKQTSFEDSKPMGLLKMMRILNKPGMKKQIGFLMTVLEKNSK